ncbi:MAG TPA: CRISPR-associated endonuclease Cas2 [Bacteroidales bacterium]|nr:MAG: CRISPR-associated endonuclease Cas2 [Bacteroidetes bacterium GWF2_33_38]OFY72445.1 MAG: CRISPR-associated endonuclease Cas2 [Bacteroidetes bacterium RIFOXYA12_FULL_33_9]OFY91364.1 MAG: CRISPR-associated endonuclease Cas2 [Bacteroidetes bacterium RIFOXYA2_FULL_33_7]HBF88956.1 CRISPR-associated endonuclease Cas2 [Bacteroidales bacterium]
MWLFVFFDLPTNTKLERKKASKFRKFLLDDGFTMMQYSVYIRHCASSESADVHQKRIENNITNKGQISILRITDKQYGNIANFWGKTTTPLETAPQQLELF